MHCLAFAGWAKPRRRGMPPPALTLAALAALLVGWAGAGVSEAVAARAGVALQARVRVLWQAGVLHGRLGLRNLSAQRITAVRAAAHVMGGWQEIGALGALEAGQEGAIAFRLPAPAPAGGDVPYMVAVDFWDGGHFPQSTLVGGVLGLDGGPRRRFEVRADDLVVAGSGELAVAFTIPPPFPQTVRVTAYLPRCLGGGRSRRVALNGDGRGRTVFPLTAETLGGTARYPYYCLVEYGEGGRAAAELGAGRVEVRPATSFWENERRVWGAVLAVFLAAGWGLAAGLARGTPRRERKSGQARPGVGKEMG